jgi:hypothetical protein
MMGVLCFDCGKYNYLIPEPRLSDFPIIVKCDECGCNIELSEIENHGGISAKRAEVGE